MYEKQNSGMLLKELKPPPHCFYFHVDVSVMMQNNVKGKFTTVLLSTVTIVDMLAPLKSNKSLSERIKKIPSVYCVGEMGHASRSSLFIRLMFVTNS